jgi:hypothetical protein
VVPAPFAVADDVDAGEFLKADGEDNVLIHAFLKFRTLHPALQAGEKESANGLGARQTSNHLRREQRQLHVSEG